MKEKILQQAMESQFDNENFDFTKFLIEPTRAVKVTNNNQLDLQQKIDQTYDFCKESLENLTFIQGDKDVLLRKQKKRNSLNPDLLCYSPVTESMVLFELKTQEGATRQAISELSGYSSALHQHLKMISESDIVKIIVSVEWPTLLRHSFIHQVVHNNSKMIALKPIFDSNDKLLNYEVLGGNFFSKDLHVINNVFEACNLSSVTLSIAAEEKDEVFLIDSLKAAKLSGTEHSSNGLVYLYTDDYDLPYKYGMQIIGFNPYTNIPSLVAENSYVANTFLGRMYDLYQDYDPTGHGITLTKPLEALQNYFGTEVDSICESFLNWKTAKKANWGIYEKDRGFRILGFAAWGIYESAIFAIARENKKLIGSQETLIKFIEEGISYDGEDWRFCDLKDVVETS